MANFEPGSGTATLVIAKAVPSVTWAPVEPIVYGTQLWTRHHTATAAVAGGFVYAEDILAVLPVGTHTLTATFRPLDWQNYQETTVTTTIVVQRATPTIGLQFYNVIYDGQPHAAGSSVRGIDWEALEPVTITYNGSPDVPVNAGTYLIVASFPGNDTYEPVSASVTREIYRAAVSNMTWLGLGTLVYGTPLGASQFQTTASVPGTFAFSPGPGAVLDAGTHTVTMTFTPTDPNYNVATMTNTVTIAKASAALSWIAPAALGYGTPLGPAQLRATATVPGTFSYTPAAGTVLGAGPSRPLSATFTPADPANYSGGSIATTVAVAPAPLTVRTNDAGKVYGAPVPALTASFNGFVAGDTPASLGGALAFATAVTSASPVGDYAVTPAGLTSPNYAITFVAGTLSVLRAPVAMTLTASPTPSGLDMPITLTATVAAAQGAPTAPAGTVRFFDGATLLGTAALSSGTATR